MLVTEETGKFIYTYSDAGFYILQTDTGIEYTDAIDLKKYPHEYEETDHPIKAEEESDDTADDVVDYA